MLLSKPEPSRLGETRSGRNSVGHHRSCAIATLLGAAALLMAASGAVAQISDDVVKIGVLTDLSGPYADSGGKGSVAAARMAAEDARLRGIGAEGMLVALEREWAALDDARRRGLQVLPSCPYVRKVIAEDPDTFLDLVPADQRARFDLKP
jgi:hypothetical protein